MVLAAFAAAPGECFRTAQLARRAAETGAVGAGEAEAADGRRPVKRKAVAEEGTDYVPSLEVFEETWDNFTRRGLAGRTRGPGSFDLSPPIQGKALRPTRMVLGIFTTLGSRDEAYRGSIRRTFMRQQGVCGIERVSAAGPDCRVFVTFVVGTPADSSYGERRSSMASPTFRAAGTPDSETSRTVPSSREDVEEAEERDMTILNVSENMNCGKSQEWFRHAASAWAEAELGVTHIAKMDMDAFLDVGRFVTVLDGFSTRCPNVFGGRSWSCARSDGAYCPPVGCGYPAGKDFLTYKGCWSYMQGGFYFMTLQMAREVSRADGWWAAQGELCNPEDAVAGHAVYEWASRSSSCVAAMDLRGMRALWHPGDPGLWVPPYRPCW